MLTGYKIVREICNRLVSATDLGRCTTYRLQVWVRPRIHCGPLSLFATEELANDFLSSLSLYHPNHYYLYRCDYFLSSKQLLWFTSPTGTIYRRRFFPTGSLLARAIRLTELIGEVTND